MINVTKKFPTIQSGHNYYKRFFLIFKCKFTANNYTRDLFDYDDEIFSMLQRKVHVNQRHFGGKARQLSFFLVVVLEVAKTSYQMLEVLSFSIRRVLNLNKNK